MYFNEKSLFSKNNEIIDLSKRFMKIIVFQKRIMEPLLFPKKSLRMRSDATLGGWAGLGPAGAPRRAPGVPCNSVPFRAIPCVSVQAWKHMKIKETHKIMPKWPARIPCNSVQFRATPCRAGSNRQRNPGESQQAMGKE